jgi:hypothetical protein
LRISLSGLRINISKRGINPWCVDTILTAENN